MVIFSHTITPRLLYITDFIKKEIGATELRITDNIDDFKSTAGVKINYSEKPIADDEFRLHPHSLLFEKGIKPQSIDCFQTNSYKAFFKAEGHFPFDIFAASFYLLSRYEEYLPHKKDMYGRYAHENSIAYREVFLNEPLINIWIQLFKQALISKFPNSKFPNSQFTFLPTYDIDEAYCFKYKTWQRSVGGAVKDLLNGRFKRYTLRRKVLNNNEADPFDSYNWLNDLHQPHHLKPRYFFLVAEKNRRLDKNILPSEPALQMLIKQQAEKYNIGVHPSWQSGDDVGLLKKEKETIEHITGIKITASRQHFIRFNLPETYRQLIETGIKEDFSMGYGSINGFRASVASAFYWYDLEKEQTTPLLLYPFCYMEANSFYEQKENFQEALEEMRHYYSEVKKVKGTLITIWHNTFLGTDEKFRGWREVYKTFVEEVAV